MATNLVHGDPAANRQGKIQAVVERLKAFFNKFSDIADADFSATARQEEPDRPDTGRKQ